MSMGAASWRRPDDPTAEADRVLAYVLPKDFPDVTRSGMVVEQDLQDFLLVHRSTEARRLGLWCYLCAIGLVDEEARPRAEAAMPMLGIWPGYEEPLRAAMQRAVLHLRGLPATRVLIDAPAKGFVDTLNVAVAQQLARRRPGPRAMRGLIPEDFVHPRDQELMRALRKIPLLDRLMGRLLDLARRAQEVQLIADGVRVTERSVPKLWSRYLDVCEVLGVDVPLPLYVSTGGTKTQVLGVDEPAVVIGAMVPTFFDSNEIGFLLGRELGHVLAGHENYLAITETVYGTAGLLADAAIPFSSWGIDLALGFRLCAWCRASELTADRVGFLAVQDREPALRALLKQAGYPPRYAADIDTRALIEQTALFRDRVNETDLDGAFEALGRLASRTPYLVQRTAELLDWVESGQAERAVSART